MPGSSLWLVPPESSELYRVCHELILKQVPSACLVDQPTHFTPHITLTADLMLQGLEGSTAQQWLDRLTLPYGETLRVPIREVEVGRVFFKKITMRCEKTSGLCELAAMCRAACVDGLGEAGAMKWVEQSYLPHLSLMYSDLPPDEVQGKMIEVNKEIQEAKQRNPGSTSTDGGAIWLVPTYKPIAEWQPVAKRELSGAEWEWQT